MLYYSNNGGNSWGKLQGDPYIENGFIVHVKVSPFYSVDQTLFASLKGLGLVESIDSGSSWAVIGNDLIDNNYLLSKIEISNSFDIDQTIFGLSTLDGELFKSIDGGDSWQKIVRPVRYENNNPVVYYQKDWKTLKPVEFSSGNSITVSNEPESRMTFQFVGSSISLIGPKSKYSGIAEVFIDGKLYGYFDQYSDRFKPMKT